MKVSNIVKKFIAPLTLALAATSSFAGSPECSVGTGSAGRQAGRNAARGSLDILWTQVVHSDCTRVEFFSDAVQLDPSDNLNSDQVYLRCRDEGYLEATYQYVGNLTQSCAIEGTKGGIIIGKTAGKAICSVYQGSPYQNRQHSYASSIPIFLTAIQQACKVSVSQYVDDNCPEAVYEPYYDELISKNCSI